MAFQVATNEFEIETAEIRLSRGKSDEISSTSSKSDLISHMKLNASSADNIRWLILLLSCFIMFGNYYAFDNPSALNRHLRAWMPDRTEAEFEYHLNLLYTIYSVPNIFLPFLVGGALDRFGSRSFLIGLSALVCLGQTIFALGVSTRSWPWMLAGRLIFGLGGESLAVAQSRLVTEWFFSKELGVAIGLNLSIARIGTVANNNISPRIADVSSGWKTGVPRACWAGLVTCLFSFICTLFCILLDMTYRPKSFEADRNGSGAFGSQEIEEKIDISKPRLLEAKSRSKKSFFHFHPAFYYLLLLNFFSYGAVLCFNNVASAYLQERYFPGGQVLQANWAMSIPDTLAIFLVPLIGMFVDRSGFKLNTILGGQVALALGHFFLANQSSPDNSPYWSLILLGFGYSTLLAIWSCVPYLVERNRQATAYGFLTASTNFSTAVLPILVAALINVDGSYHQVGIFFTGLGLFGMALGAILYRMDLRRVLALNSSKAPSLMEHYFYRVRQQHSKWEVVADSAKVPSSEEAATAAIRETENKNSGFENNSNYNSIPKKAPIPKAFAPPIMQQFHQKSDNKISDFAMNQKL